MARQVDKDLEIQELVFIASLYTDPQQLRKHGALLSSEDVFQTPRAKSIWKKSWEYYMKYHALPNEDDVLDKLFTADEIDFLNVCVDIAQNESDRAGYLCDQFQHTLDLVFLKAIHKEIDDIVNNPRISTQDGGKYLDTAMDRLLGKIAKVRTGMSHANVSVKSSDEVRRAWENNEYPSQEAMFPLPIPGISDYMEGVPVGSVNVVVAGYGAGKSSLLACMASEYTQHCDVLYITLEMPENAIYFKALAHLSNGYVNMKSAFKKYADAMQINKDLEHYDKANKKLAEKGHQIYLLDAPPDTLRPMEIANHLMHIMAEYKVSPKVVIIDYASLLRSNDGSNRSDSWQYIGQITTELSMIAKQYNLVIWTAAQAGGEQAHTGAVAEHAVHLERSEIKPMGGGDLYGSKESLQNATLVLALKALRSATCPWIASGVLSTLKNRFSEAYHNYLVRVDYSKSRVTVMNPLINTSKSAMGDAVYKDMKLFANEAEKDGRDRGLERIKDVTSAIRKAKPKADPRTIKTQGHDEAEYL